MSKPAIAKSIADEPQASPRTWVWPDDFVSLDSGRLFIREDFVPVFEKLRWTTFDAVFDNTECVVFRKISNRDNCVMELPVAKHAVSKRAFLKRHRDRAYRPWLKANKFGHGWRPAGLAEADAVRLCQLAEVPTLAMIAAGSKSAGENPWEYDSFFMSEEIAGALPADTFWKGRFASADAAASSRESEEKTSSTSKANESFPRLAEIPRGDGPCRADLLTRFAEMAKRMHASGLFHRDFYWCHFFVGEPNPEEFDVKLIDLQRIHRPKLLTWRWKLKDLAQFVFSMPEGMLTSAERELWFRTYRGVDKLGLFDRLWLRLIEFRASLYARREERRR